MKQFPTGSFLLLILGLAAVASAAAPRTMRVDYFHTGNAAGEVFSLDRVVLEPLPWPGNPKRPIDDTNLGKYFFEVVDRGDEPRPLLARLRVHLRRVGARRTRRRRRARTFSESLRFPAPAGPVQIVLKKRDARNAFREIWTFTLDPKDMFVDSSAPPSPGPLIEIQKSGDSADKVDFLILGDGYTAAERGKFEKDARRLTELLFAVSPFKERRGDFNVWALCPPAEESGISRPSTGVHRRSRIGATYDAFGSERYVLTFENESFRDVASFAPYEFVEILTNSRTYGGGGIFSLYARSPPTASGRPTSSSTSSATTSPASPTSTSRPTVAYEAGAGRARRALGAQRHGAARSRRTSSGRTSSCPARRSRRRGPRRSSRRPRATSRSGAARSAPPTGPRTEMDALFREEQVTRRSCSAPTSTPERSARSRARSTSRRATTGRRKTASCSRATRCRSAPSAGGRSTGVIDLYSALDR